MVEAYARSASLGSTNGGIGFLLLSEGIENFAAGLEDWIVETMNVQGIHLLCALTVDIQDSRSFEGGIKNSLISHLVFFSLLIYVTTQQKQIKCCPPVLVKVLKDNRLSIVAAV